MAQVKGWALRVVAAAGRALAGEVAAHPTAARALDRAEAAINKARRDIERADHLLAWARKMRGKDATNAN